VNRKRAGKPETPTRVISIPTFMVGTKREECPCIGGEKTFEGIHRKPETNTIDGGTDRPTPMAKHGCTVVFPFLFATTFHPHPPLHRDPGTFPR